MDLVLRLPPEWRDSPEKIDEMLVENSQRPAHSPVSGGRRARSQRPERD